MTTALPADERPAPAPALALADDALRRFRAMCFWFRNSEAKVATVGDVQLVVRRLRQHGDRAAWDVAYQIEQCL
jgi:hypothetical protein